jgi:S1-C subfamily serine protease
MINKRLADMIPYRMSLDVNVSYFIQTTCAVHAGASGGAVVDKYGRLVGIAVSNAK